MPLPPIEEQQRIATTLESAFAVIDKIENNKIDLQTAVTTAKSKVLSLAVCGKLVPQDPNDEPASVLLERIRAERESLIKAGKIKRNKNESTIARNDDNSYYEQLPEGWVWCQLCEISQSIQYGLSNSAEPLGNHRLLRITDIQTIWLTGIVYLIQLLQTNKPKIFVSI